MIPITTKEQFFAAKQAAEEMIEIRLFGAIYLVRGANFDAHTKTGSVDVMQVQRVNIPQGELDHEWRGPMGETTGPAD